MAMKLRKGITNEGFTIVELLVAMAISGVIATAIFTTYNSQQKAYEITLETTALQQNIRATMYSIIRDIRMAGYDPLRTGNFTFTNIDADTVTFTMDTDMHIDNPPLPDGNVGASETITYSYNAGNNTIDLAKGGSTEPIALDITNLTFAFFKADGSPATVGADVRAVDITLSVGQGGRNRQMTCRIFCRNMGL